MSDKIFDGLLVSQLGALVEQQHRLPPLPFAQGVQLVALSVERVEGDDAVISSRMLQRDYHVLVGERLVHIVRVEHPHAVLLHAGEQDIVSHVEVQSHHRHAPLPQGVHHLALGADGDAGAAEVAAGDGQLLDAPVAVQPVAQEHHGRAGCAALPRRALRSVAVQAVEHDVADDVRRDLLPLKEEADGVEHGGGAAVVFRQLVMQWILHGRSLLGQDQPFHQPCRPLQFGHAAVLLAGVAAVHTGRHHQTGDAVVEEVVVVAAAVGDGQLTGQV